MARAASDPLKEARRKIAEIHEALSGMEHLSTGSITKRMKLCGNPKCQCRVDRAARHGPYYEWGFVEGGKLRHRMLSPKRAEMIRLAIGNYRKVKKLLKAWEAETVRVMEITIPE